jgi:hypothetical protein
MEINGNVYNDLVLTMELIQAPSKLTYTQLGDPGKVAQEARAKKKADH